ncbi:MAG: polysaccharide deacetylase family protein [Candidatus Omnitrophica bacterium]|nr:polysaccharide deacetylase family protein [Candidatus Omnitrophota bacterium]
MNIVKKLKKSTPWWIKSSVARLKRTGIILMYHRINDSQNDPYYLNVSPKNFDEQMSILKKHGKTIQMQKMGERVSKFNLRSDDIAVTFDDGIRDNFYNAKPVLEKYEIPATFYIPSHSIESQQEAWWDKLARILTSPILPNIFEISIGNMQYRWNIDSSPKEGSVAFNDKLPPMNSLISKKQLLFSTWRMIKPLDFQQQINIVEQILTWSGQSSDAQSAYLPMTLNQLNVMADSKLFEIGAHTVHHPWLSDWPIKHQEEEILVGRQNLEKWLNKEITSFAYPFGNYSDQTPGILKRLRFQNACTTAEGPVKRNMDSFLLPRFMVFNWNGELFEQKLRYWLTLRI